VIYAETILAYPDLVEIAKDKKKRSLKPIVLFQSDLDALESEMVKTFGSNSLHTPVVWRQGVPDDDNENDDGNDDDNNDDDDNDKPDITTKSRHAKSRRH
jgi:phosphopantothenoylcysteine synthetase/decarboxylase